LHVNGLRAIHSTTLYFSIHNMQELSATALPSRQDTRMRVVSLARL